MQALLTDAVSTAIFITGIGATGEWVREVGPFICKSEPGSIFKVSINSIELIHFDVSSI
jgi:hypothetical protein